MEVVDRFVPCLLVLLQPDSQTMLFSRLDRLSAALEVLRYLYLINGSFSLIVHRGENLLLFVVPHAISECDLLVDCQTVECFSIDNRYVDVPLFVSTTHFFDLRNVRHTRIWTKVIISSLTVVRRPCAWGTLSVIELIGVIHH